VAESASRESLQAAADNFYNRLSRLISRRRRPHVDFNTISDTCIKIKKLLNTSHFLYFSQSSDFFTKLKLLHFFPGFLI
jgi:hypothetical protein